VDLIRSGRRDIMPELKVHPQTYVSSAPICAVHQIELDMRYPPFDRSSCARRRTTRSTSQSIIQKLMGGLGTQVATTCSRRPSASTRT